MRLKPLKSAYSREDEPSAQISVRCKITKACVKWEEAVRAGWVCDLDGPPFRDYYSPEGLKALAAPRQVNPESQEKSFEEPDF